VTTPTVIQVNPDTVVSAAILALDEIINLIKHLKVAGGLTDEQLISGAQALDVQNLDDIAKFIKA